MYNNHMDSIADLIKSKAPNEPPQIKALKSYVLKHHKMTVQVSITQLGYSLTVPNGMLATTLQMEMPKIQTECGLDKKLFIRIGSI